MYGLILKSLLLTLPVPVPDEDRELAEIFIFTLLCVVSKGIVVKAFKAFMKSFETPQRSVKIIV